MAAVTGGLVEAKTTQLDPDDKTEFAKADERLKAMGHFDGLAGALKQLPSVPVSHAGLTRTVWVRRILEQWAAQQQFQVVRGGLSDSGRVGANSGQLVFRLLGPPMPKTLIPWMTTTRDWQEFSLWGESGKMKCPTWDLPAGGLFVGGACPGADAGQTVTDPRVRRAHVEVTQDQQVFLKVPAPGIPGPVPVIEGGTICSACYAFEGNYPSPHVQLGEVLRFWWIRTLLEQRRDQELVDTLVLSMKLLRYPETPYGILPVRIHSAGDFYSQQYAKVWIEAANTLHRMGGNAARIRMWAPTRTWAQWGPGFWEQELPRLASVRDGAAPNLMVRASAYNFNDRAPESFAPGNARGSTSLLQSQDRGRLERNESLGLALNDPRRFMALPTETRYDWACPTYAIEQDTHTCANATNPEGGTHCRACWVRPELRVHYTAH